MSSTTTNKTFRIVDVVSLQRTGRLGGVHRAMLLVDAAGAELPFLRDSGWKSAIFSEKRTVWKATQT